MQPSLWRGWSKFYESPGPPEEEGLETHTLSKIVGWSGRAAEVLYKVHLRGPWKHKVGTYQGTRTTRASDLGLTPNCWASGVDQWLHWPGSVHWE